MTYSNEKNMKSITFLLLLTSINLLGQKSVFKWSDELCNYEGIYDSNKFSEAQLKNCYELVYNQTLTIENTPVVFKPEDIEKLDIHKLDDEYTTKLIKFKNLDLPESAYWNELKTSVIKEFEQMYKVSRITYQGFSNPEVFKNWFYQDSCLHKHTSALINGGDSLLGDWFELTSSIAKNNCCPDDIWDRYTIQLNSQSKFLYAKIEIITFGWWNCALNYVESSNAKFDIDSRQREFLKLFTKTKTVKCYEP